MNVSIGGIAKTVEITSFDKLGDVKVCMLTTTADGSVGFEQLSDEVRDTIFASFPVDNAKGSIASFEDGADNVPVRELKLNLEPYQNLNGYANPWVGGAGENLYANSSISGSQNGLVIAHDATTETYSLSAGTVSAYAQIISSETFDLKAGTYYFSLFGSTALSGVYAQLRSSDGTTTYGGTSASFTLTSDTTVKARIVANANVVIPNNFTIKLMIVSGSTAPSVWSPYENICPIYPANKKNLLPRATDTTVPDVTFTVNEDNSITLNGTANSGLCDCYFVGGANGNYQLSNIPTGRYILSGGIAHTVLFIVKEGGTIVAQAADSNTAIVDIDSSIKYRIFLRAQSGNTFSKAKVYPMLRPVEITDPTYVPYNAIGITRTGKNLVDLANIHGSSGNVSAIVALPQGTYYTYQFTKDMNHNMYWQYEFDGNYITMSTTGDEFAKLDYSSGVYNRAKNKITLYQGCTIRLSVGQNANTASYPVDVMLTTDATGYSDFPSSGDTSAYKDSMYEPYTAERYYPISSNPVYGGTLEVETGVLTVTHTKVDMGSLNWSKGTYFSTYNIDGTVKRPSSNAEKADAICEWYPIVARDYVTDGKFSIQYNGAIVGLDSRYGDANSFKTAVNGVKFVYPLATPQTYQLTPTQVKTLLGYNNIWTDSGTVEVQYRANIGLYIQKIIGSSEDDMIANQNIAANQYFFVGEELYYSTSAISAGQTIIVGTNCIKTTLADALNALNS